MGIGGGTLPPGSTTIRLFSHSEAGRNPRGAAGGRERERSRTGADDTAGDAPDTSARIAVTGVGAPRQRGHRRSRKRARHRPAGPSAPIWYTPAPDFPGFMEPSFMGKGDRRTRRGKLYRGSFGKTRAKDPAKKKRAAKKK